MKHSQSKTVQAVIHLEVPEFQIGQEASIYFKDTMCMKGTCEKPKTGHWTKDNLWRKPYCSECGNSCFGVHGFDYITTDFCPNCGAKMESECNK